MPPKIGKIITSSRVFAQADFDQFAALSGDDNPIHVDPDFAATTRFGATVAHGMLLYGGICGLIDEHFPGLAQIDQNLMFMAPTFANEEITIRGEVVEVDTASSQFKMAILMTATAGKVVCDGDTILQWRVR